MRLPFLKQQYDATKRQVLAFGGLDFTDGAQDGTLSDCENLSSSRFPCLAPRSSREKIKEYTAPSNIFAKGKLCVVDGKDFIYDGKSVGTVTEGRKTLVSIGASVVIFPDKKYYNTATSIFGALENLQTCPANKLTFATGSCTTTGSDFAGFKAGDAVTFSGCTVAPENNKTVIIRSIETKKLVFYDNTFTAGAETAAVTIARKVPSLTCVCESNNRLWGCADGQIMGCKLGDPFNWYVYDGLSTDSYAVAVGSDGDFTGCIAYSSHIAFFKENCVHKLFGSKPANFQVQTSNIFGVAEGCAASMKVINETLFYKGRGGIFAYTGGVPELVSRPLGNVRFTDAVAATDGSKYYISMKRGDDWALYVFDVEKNIWHKEDNIHVIDFARLDGDLLFLCADDKTLYKVNSGRERVRWSATFNAFTETTLDRKCISTIGARIDISEGAYLKIEVCEDGREWRQAFITPSARKKTIHVPIMPARCDSFCVKISGEGDCTLRYLERTMQFGSER